MILTSQENLIDEVFAVFKILKKELLVKLSMTAALSSMLLPLSVSAAPVYQVIVNDAEGENVLEQTIEEGQEVKIKFEDNNVKISGDVEYDVTTENGYTYYTFTMPENDIIFDLLESSDKKVLIGDSRTVGMYLATAGSNYLLQDSGSTVLGQDGNTYWIAKTGAGLSWMKEHADDANDFIEEGTDIYIMMGVNDCRDSSSAESYANYINEKAKEWEALGANVIFVSVNPISSSTSYSTKDSNVTEFNEEIQDSLNDDVTYLSTYDSIVGSISYASDGLHYTSSTYKDIYELIMGM